MRRVAVRDFGSGDAPSSVTTFSTTFDTGEKSALSTATDSASRV